LLVVGQATLREQVEQAPAVRKAARCCIENLIQTTTRGDRTEPSLLVGHLRCVGEVRLHEGDERLGQHLDGLAPERDGTIVPIAPSHEERRVLRVREVVAEGSVED
jgi:hypothetical protein